MASVTKRIRRTMNLRATGHRSRHGHNRVRGPVFAKGKRQIFELWSEASLQQHMGANRAGRSRASKSRKYPEALGWQEPTIMVAEATGIKDPREARTVLDRMIDAFPGSVSNLSPRAFAMRARIAAGMDPNAAGAGGRRRTRR